MIINVAILASFILVIDGTDDERRLDNTSRYQPATFDRHNDEHTTQQRLREMMIHQKHTMLNMTLCVDKCAGYDCKSYITPINECYSSSRLFPNDPSWSGKDVYDTISICRTQTLTRTIYDTENGTCHSSNSTGDKFHIPLNECVGPFGKPRPWGSFRLIQQQQNGNVTTKIGDQDLSSLLCEIDLENGNNFTRKNQLSSIS